jgi:hypothetical protein
MAVSGLVANLFPCPVCAHARLVLIQREEGRCSPENASALAGSEARVFVENQVEERQQSRFVQCTIIFVALQQSHSYI